jgi:hypothetical protein
MNTLTRSPLVGKYANVSESIKTESHTVYVESHHTCPCSACVKDSEARTMMRVLIVNDTVFK